MISKKNYPNIIQLGNVKDWDKWDIEWKGIDLVIGGSPCTDLSSSGKRKGLEGERSSLCYYYRFILNMIKKFNPNVKFLLENVKMKSEYRDKISEDLGVKPMAINSALVSAQNRTRLYWFNWDCDYPEDKNICVESILETKGVVRERCRVKPGVQIFDGPELTKSFCIQKDIIKEHLHLGKNIVEYSCRIIRSVLLRLLNWRGCRRFQIITQQVYAIRDAES